MDLTDGIIDNQEDSVILNGDAVDRGFFGTIFYRTYSEKAQKHRSVTTATERFCKPDKKVAKGGRVSQTYNKIDDQGLPTVGTFFEAGDVLIGKEIELKGDEPQTKDASTLIKNNEEGWVDMVVPSPEIPMMAYNAEGTPFIKARVSIFRKPEIGDKFASRYSQKGTTGFKYKAHDLPFTAQGLVPDIIMNPHGIPSRMTIGKLLETMLGKIAVCTGRIQDATPFIDYDFDGFKRTLKAYGFDEMGQEVMYNGQTGQMYDAIFFYGPTYYQRLKHMVADKMHCTKGDHDVLTMKGWKPIPEITMDDEIATLKDNRLVYEKPIQIFHYPDYQGRMYHIKSQQVDLCVTPDHRMWVSKSDGCQRIWQPHTFETAEQIMGQHRKYKKDAEWETPDYQFILPAVGSQIDKVVDMEAWLTFLGIWMAKGCVVQTEIVVQCKKRVNKALYPALDKLGYRYCASGHTIDDYNLYISDHQLHTYLAPLSPDAPYKRLPDWVWKLSKQQAIRLIESMILGDGTYTKSGMIVYYTSSKGLADDVQRLCLHAGWSGNIHIHLKAGHTTTKKDDLLSVRIVKSGNTPAVNHGQQKIQVEEMIENFHEPVYCLQVPSEVFYVRRNGIPVWTGNSRESGPVQLMTRQPAEGRSRDGGLRLGEMERDVLIAHGIPKFLKERMMDSSDLFKAYVSRKEETMIVGNPEQKIYKFNGQQIKDDEVVQIQLPYAMKLLLQELQSMGIDIRLKMA